MHLYKVINNLKQNTFIIMIMVAGIGWILDFTTYIIFIKLNNDIFLSNIIGNLIGVIFTFTIGMKFGFKTHRKFSFFQLLIFIIYTFTIMSILSLLLEFIVNKSIVNYLLGKVIITVPSFFLNYFFLKFQSGFIRQR